jgi:hypothetical protein
MEYVILVSFIFLGIGFLAYSRRKKENFDRLHFPGVPISGYTDGIISVFEEDKEEAKTIIQEYIDAIRTNNREKIGNLFRTLMEFAVVGNTIRSGSNKSLPELLV